MAGAIEDGAPLADNYNLSFRVHRQLTTHKDYWLRPHKIEDQGWIFSYYISELTFLGRAKTREGYRNLFYVSYIRSSRYKTYATGPARGYHYLLSVTDSGDITLYGRTDASRSEVGLDGSVLKIESNKIDLNTPQGMKYLREVRPL